MYLYSTLQILKLLDMLDMRKYQMKFAQESTDGAILLECDQSTLLHELEVTSKLYQINLNVVNFITVVLCFGQVM